MQDFQGCKGRAADSWTWMAGVLDPQRTYQERAVRSGEGYYYATSGRWCDVDDRGNQDVMSGM